MKARARRDLSRLCEGFARRGWLVVGVWLASAGVVAGDGAVIVAVAYGNPTTRYDHGVLGDAVEWGSLELTLSDGRNVSLVLPETRVFEDVAPRLADLDGDSAPEVITVEASLTLGARLAVYDPSGLLAATPNIGTPHRWLAPVGAADLDGDGAVEIAYIDRPHLAKRLRVWRYEGGRLTHVADREGLSNHKIGWDFIAGGLRDCGARPEMILASGDWRHVVAASLVAGAITTKVMGRYTGSDSLNAALTCP